MPYDGFRLDDTIKGCKNFKYREALKLPTWEVTVYPEFYQFENINRIGPKLQQLRDTVLEGRKVFITNWLRPPKYNKEIGGSKYSAHPYGNAIDFWVEGLESNKVRIIILPCLDALGIRMEKMDTAHVHIDDKPVGISGERYFIPGSP